MRDYFGEEPELFRPQLVAASLDQDSGPIGALLLSMDAAYHHRGMVAKAGR